MTKDLRIHSAGEAALIAYFADEASPEVAAQIQATAERLRSALGDMLVDLTPSYASLLVAFDPYETDQYFVQHTIRVAAQSVQATEATEGRLVELPAYYHPDCGQDLIPLAKAKGMDWEEIVRIHSEREYRVYAIGFAPGFAYLGDVDERIAAPRLSTPRQAVPRGAVAIADRQTAVYPAVSPGGWNLIGLSPLRMFDPAADPTMPVGVGDRVRFVPVDRQSFLDAGGEL
ncbi:MAG: 5-oxoprolinase subunit PxpB [Pseudomonadota bacterium]